MQIWGDNTEDYMFQDNSNRWLKNWGNSIVRDSQVIIILNLLGNSNWSLVICSFKVGSV